MNAHTANDYRGLLSELRDTIQGFTDSSDRYFRRTGEIAHCIALGLATYGASFLENGTSPNREMLMAYLNAWMGGLK